MNSWDKMEKAKEGSYFEKKNKEALERLNKKQNENKPRLSPITGEPMTQEILMGIVIDRCKKSGGVWLDSGELEKLIETSQEQGDTKTLGNFFKSIVGS